MCIVRDRLRFGCTFLDTILWTSLTDRYRYRYKTFITGRGPRAHTGTPGTPRTPLQLTSGHSTAQPLLEEPLEGERHQGHRVVEVPELVRRARVSDGAVDWKSARRANSAPAPSVRPRRPPTPPRSSSPPATRALLARLVLKTDERSRGSRSKTDEADAGLLWATSEHLRPADTRHLHAPRAPRAGRS